MRNGGVQRPTGHVRKPIPQSTRFICICFVIADFSPRLIELVSMSIAQNKSADGEGFFGFSAIHNAVVEVLPYNKLLHDARLRNEAFFAKLGVTCESDPTSRLAGVATVAAEIVRLARPG